EEITLRPSSGSDGAMTLPGTPLGTPAYMSPEQAAGRHQELGPASDVYGLGATLYHLLTGRAPFAGGDAHDVAQRARAGDYAAPRSVRPGIPRALEAICLKAMALRPEDRYATPLALAEEIEHWLADEPVAAYRERPDERLVRWTRRNRQWAAAAPVIVVLLGAMAGGSSIAAFWYREMRDRERVALGQARPNLERAQANLRRATHAEGSAVRFAMGLAEKLVHSRKNDQAVELYRKEVIPRLEELIRDNPQTPAYSLALGQA